MNVLSLLGISLADAVGKKYPTTHNRAHIRSAIDWLIRAQDVTTDGGVSAWYSLLSGWRSSYIETTGYIINTFLACAEYLQDDSLVPRAIEMADFLVAMQLKNGGYRTHVPADKKNSPPTIFDTGQDLIGLVEIYQLTKNKTYLNSLTKAADFLCKTMNGDGAWQKYTFGNHPHTYHTRVSWGLAEVYAVTHDEKYRVAAIRSLDWAAANQLENGWFTQNEFRLARGSITFTHTTSYAIEGFLWSGLLLRKAKYVEIAERAARPLAEYFLKHSFLPASFDENWQSRDRYSCLTGDAQLALVWGALYQHNNDQTYYKAMKKMNRYLKQLQNRTHPDDGVRGAIKGSQPIYGDILKNQGYCRMAYLNWATKFFVDALLMEETIESQRR